MKKGQVWVETIVYTLIGLVLIGLVLAVMTPKIKEIKDKATIDQTIDAMKVLDGKISEVVEEGAGNIRNVEFGMKRGSLTINGVDNSIVYVLEDSKSLYSEPGIETSIGRISVKTEEGSPAHKVTLKILYDSDIQTAGGDEIKTYTAAAVPYRFSIKNGGFSENGEIIIMEDIGQ